MFLCSTHRMYSTRYCFKIKRSYYSTDDCPPICNSPSLLNEYTFFYILVKYLYILLKSLKQPAFLFYERYIKLYSYIVWYYSTYFLTICCIINAVTRLLSVIIFFHACTSRSYLSVNVNLTFQILFFLPFIFTDFPYPLAT